MGTVDVGLGLGCLVWYEVKIIDGVMLVGRSKLLQYNCFPQSPVWARLLAGVGV